MHEHDFRAMASMPIERSPFPLVRQDYRIFIDETVVDKINQQSNKEYEIGGVLVGEAYTDDGGPYLRIDDLIPAVHAAEHGTELTFTHETWEHIQRELDGRHTGKKVVGWYHTHPGFGIFLSDQDRFIQQNFFAKPFQIALVYDPVKREHGVFVWREGKPWRLRRYWIGESEHVWDGNREQSPATSRPRPPQQEQPSSTPYGVHTVQQGLADPMTDFTLFSLPLYQVLMFGALAVALLSGLMGFIAGSKTAALEARADGARQAVASLNTDLLDALKVMLGYQSVRQHIDVTTEQLRGLLADKSVLSDEATKKRLREFLAEMESAGTQSALSDELVSRLGKQIKQTKASREAVVKRLSAHDQAITDLLLYTSELLWRQQQGKAAEALLRRASIFDPRNKKRYDQQLARLRPTKQ